MSLTRLRNFSLHVDISTLVNVPSQQRKVIGQKGRTVVQGRKSAVKHAGSNCDDHLHLWDSLLNQSGQNDHEDAIP